MTCQDKSIYHRFEVNQASFKIGAVACNLLYMIRDFHLHGNDLKRSMAELIHRIIKTAARIFYSGHRWCVHVAISFPLVHHHKAVLGTG